MKKLLLSIISLLIIILIGFTIVKGLKIGNINVLGITEIKQQNDDLDILIKDSTKLASTDYQKKINDLNNEIKKLELEKSNYEDMVNVSTESEVEAANQSYDHMIEFLLIRVENHAKSEGVTMKMEVTRSSSGAENVYNLNFTATGSYIGIEEFITHIEDDSKLGFKIEDFRMIASSENGNVVQATFTCRDISIEGISTNNFINSTSKPLETDSNNNINSTNTTDSKVNNNTNQ